MQHSSTILIVDDQLSGREVLRGLLTNQGYELAFASDGQEALAKAVELTPDLILLDVMMPGMDGFEVCQRLRADPDLAEVPVIMVTALDDHDSRLRGIEVGSDDFVSKPFNQVELQARVRSITRLNRYRRLLMERTYREQAEEEVYRRNRELTWLNQVITTAASTFNIQDTLYVACEALAQAFELPQATAMLLHQESTQFTALVEYRTPSFNLEQTPFDKDERLNQEIPIVGLLSEYLSESKVPLAVVDEPTDRGLTPVYELMRQHGVASLLVIPIVVDEEIAGIIELKETERRTYSEQDLKLAQSVATAVGQALETTQLYQALEDHAATLEETVAQRTHELQTERDRTQAILEALGEAVVVTDLSGAIQYLNPAAVTLTGYPEKEAVGKNWHLWQSRTTREREINDSGGQILDEISDLVRTGQTWRGEVNNKRRDGSLYDALLTVAPLSNPGHLDQTIGFVTVQSDITPLKEAERIRTLHQEREKQAALDRLRHTFLSTVNHEMRTPLALIFQSIEMLEDPQFGELIPDQLDAVMAIRRQSWTLGQMVEGLTRVAAFLSKQETVRPVLALLEPVFNSLLPLAEFKARSKELTVETNIAPNLPSFPLDVKQIEEALTQLVDNAVKFNHPGGKIKISAQANDAWVMIAVSDTGRGIEEEHLDRIWEVFEQGTDPLRRAQEGLGLGLVLARYIVEAHRGTIEIETSPGQGSTFTVKLPRVKARKLS